MSHKTQQNPRIGRQSTPTTRKYVRLKEDGQLSTTTNTIDRHGAKNLVKTHTPHPPTLIKDEIALKEARGLGSHAYLEKIRALALHNRLVAPYKKTTAPHSPP